jgi:predicted metal-dependent enzyme (double-stranded beta helix superfamily)
VNLDLNTFAAQCHVILKKDSGPAGREQVAELLRQVLQDAEAVKTYLTPNTPEREVLYEDPELGFCIVAHRYTGPKTSEPHDHAHSWAIYGQATGETQMHDYVLVEKKQGSTLGKVKMTQTYSLTPGVAHVYNEGDIHSPTRVEPTSLIRIEGTNMAKVARDRFELLS